MDEKAKVYAKLAQQAYRQPGEDNIDGYEIMRTYSTDRVKVYTKGNELVFAIRGTDIKNVNDLLADVNIFYNSLTKSRVYMEIRSQLEFLLSQKIMRNYTLVGHSLGGGIATELLLEFPNRIDAVYTFNSGIGYHRFIRNLADRIKCRVIPNLDGCAELEILKKKLHVYITGWDPISVLNISTPGNVNFVKPVRANVHSMWNFIGRGGMLVDINQVIDDLKN